MLKNCFVYHGEILCLKTTVYSGLQSTPAIENTIGTAIQGS